MKTLANRIRKLLAYLYYSKKPAQAQAWAVSSSVIIFPSFILQKYYNTYNTFCQHFL